MKISTSLPNEDLYRTDRSGYIQLFIIQVAYNLANLCLDWVPKHQQIRSWRMKGIGGRIYSSPFVWVCLLWLMWVDIHKIPTFTSVHEYIFHMTSVNRLIILLKKTHQYMKLVADFASSGSITTLFCLQKSPRELIIMKRTADLNHPLGEVTDYNGLGLWLPKSCLLLFTPLCNLSSWDVTSMIAKHWLAGTVSCFLLFTLGKQAASCLKIKNVAWLHS